MRRRRLIASGILLVDAAGLWFAWQIGLIVDGLCVDYPAGSGGVSRCFTEDVYWDPELPSFVVGAPALLSLAFGVFWCVGRARRALVASAAGAVAAGVTAAFFLAEAMLDLGPLDL
jgi:hypothetical protein